MPPAMPLIALSEARRLWPA